MQSNHYSIYKHVMPEFGPMRMMDILPEHVRAWIKRMKKNGVSRGAAEPSPQGSGVVEVTA